MVSLWLRLRRPRAGSWPVAAKRRPPSSALRKDPTMSSSPGGSGGFDISKLSRGTQVAGVAAIVLLISFFLPWVSFKAEHPRPERLRQLGRQRVPARLAGAAVRDPRARRDRPGDLRAAGHAPGRAVADHPRPRGDRHLLHGLARPLPARTRPTGRTISRTRSTRRPATPPAISATASRRAAAGASSSPSSPPSASRQAATCAEQRLTSTGVLAPTCIAEAPPEPGARLGRDGCDRPLDRTSAGLDARVDRGLPAEARPAPHRCGAAVAGRGGEARAAAPRRRLPGPHRRRRRPSPGGDARPRPSGRRTPRPSPPRRPRRVPSRPPPRSRRSPPTPRPLPPTPRPPPPPRTATASVRSAGGAGAAAAGAARAARTHPSSSRACSTTATRATACGSTAPYATPPSTARTGAASARSSCA